MGQKVTIIQLMSRISHQKLENRVSNTVLQYKKHRHRGAFLWMLLCRHMVMPRAIAR